MMFTASPLLDHAHAYIKLGFRVFPCQHIAEGMCNCGDPLCKGPGKHPLTPRGLLNASSLSIHIQSWWTTTPDANIGMRTGDGLVVIDVDIGPGKEGDDTLQLLEKAHGDLPHTVESITGSGGRHIFLRYDPNKYTVKSGTNVLGHGIDIRADGGYVIVPPSSHSSGSRYEWNLSNDPASGTPYAIAPQWVLDLCMTKKETQLAPPIAGGRMAPHLVKEVRSAMASIDCEDRDQWLEVGMGLHDESGGSMQGYGLWTEWSQQSEKYDPKVQQHTWNSFKRHGKGIGTIIYRARENGWESPPPDNVASISKMIGRGKDKQREEEEAAIPQDDDTQAAYVSEKKPSPTKVPLMRVPPGLLADMHKHILQHSYAQQHNLALSAAISVVATAAGGKLKTATGLRTVLYTLNVAGTGGGKEAPRKVAREILEAAGMGGLIGGDRVASGSALLKNMADRPTTFFSSDEFGLKLQRAVQNRGGLDKEVVDTYIEMYSKAGSTYRGTEYSSIKNMKPIHDPCIILYAMSTMEMLTDALTSGDAVSGLLNRFLFFEGQPRIEVGSNRKVKDAPRVPKKITDALTIINHPQSTTGNLAGTGAGAPITVNRDMAAEKLLDDYEDESLLEMHRHDGEPVGALYARVREHAEKLAMICALSRDPHTRLIIAEDAEWAIEVVKLSQDRMVAMVVEHVADSEFERTWKEIMREVESIERPNKKRPQGRNATRSAIEKSRVGKRLKRQDVDNVLNKLIGMGKLIYYRELRTGSSGPTVKDVYITPGRLARLCKDGGGIVVKE